MKFNLYILLILFLVSVDYSLCQYNDYPLIQDPSSITMNVPKGWILTGTNAKDYETGIRNNDSKSGQSSAFLKSLSGRPVGFATLLQELKADNYKGERVRFTAFIKSNLVVEWAALWMKVEDQYKRILGFDNMQDRLIKGSSEWILHEIVLDVPYNSDVITFGITLNGKGEVLIDDVKLVTVSKEINVTDMSEKLKKNFYPVNSDFEE